MLKMKVQVNKVLQMAWFHLYFISKNLAISEERTNTVSNFMPMQTPRLNQNNSLLSGAPATVLN